MFCPLLVVLYKQTDFNGVSIALSDGINEVKAMCRLFVRLVTKDMLDNSITIRLNNIDQKAFLSPLYQMFLSALASVIPTTEDNVFIVNVQDDIEVKEKILNISFSVRQRKDSIKDVFYSSQFLRERVYLQRLLLAKLSTLEVGGILNLDTVDVPVVIKCET